jgi:TRIAP1/MDM35 family protein
MAHSLEERCTPLKLEYDSCFNSWFEGYLEPAVSVSASPENRAEYSKAKAEEYERKCGKIWASYRDCVQVRLNFFSLFFFCLSTNSHYYVGFRKR